MTLAVAVPTRNEVTRCPLAAARPTRAATPYRQLTVNPRTARVITLAALDVTNGHFTAQRMV
jgi:hypothetical protein